MAQQIDTEKMEAAYRWLDKAIVMETEEKSPGLVDKALQRACNLEKEALGLPA